MPDAGEQRAGQRRAAVPRAAGATGGQRAQAGEQREERRAAG